METYDFTTRRRVILTQALYAFERNSFNESDDFIMLTMQISRYCNQEHLNTDIAILKDILSKISNIDQKILLFVKNPNVPSVVFALLRVGTYEILYNKGKHNIGGVIKDYLNAASAFSHNEEVGFINKILDSIQKAEAEQSSA